MASGRPVFLSPPVIVSVGTRLPKLCQLSQLRMLTRVSRFREGVRNGVAIDGRYHCERANCAASSSEAYKNAMLRTWRTGNEYLFLYGMDSTLQRRWIHASPSPSPVSACRVSAGRWTTIRGIRGRFYDRAARGIYPECDGPAMTPRPGGMSGCDREKLQDRRIRSITSAP